MMQAGFWHSVRSLPYLCELKLRCRMCNNANPVFHHSCLQTCFFYSPTFDTCNGSACPAHIYDALA